MKITYGITGNYYATSYKRTDLVELCWILNKSDKSIYYNKKYGTYAISVKDKKQKKILKEMKCKTSK